MSRTLIVIDMAEVMRQLGLSPLTGTRGERVVVALQRLQACVTRGRSG